MYSDNYTTNRKLILQLGTIAQLVGDEVLAHTDPNASRKSNVQGHQISTITDVARSIMDSHFFGELGADFFGRLLTVLRPLLVRPTESVQTQRGAVLAHESSGGVDLWRSKVGGVPYRPMSAVGLALCETSDFADLVGGAVYGINQQMLIDAVRVNDDCFEAHVHNKRLFPDGIPKSWPDEQIRVVIPDYNNASVHQRAELTEKLWEAGFYVCPGSHSSMLDLVNTSVLRRIDACIDMRVHTANPRGEQDSVLSLKEVAAAIPICLGCGWKVTDCKGENWSTFRITEPFSLLVATPEVHERLLDIVRPLIETWES